MDFLEDSPFAEVLLDRITAKRVIQAQRYAALGPDAIMFGDDVGTQRGMLMSPALWRRWLKPRLAAAIAAARAVRPDVLIAYHTDGDVTRVVADLIEIGVQVLNPVQPECMDPFALKRQIRRPAGLLGRLGDAVSLPLWHARRCAPGDSPAHGRGGRRGRAAAGAHPHGGAGGALGKYRGLC